MATLRSSPKKSSKASKASKTSKGTKTSLPTITKSSRVSKSTPKAKRTPQGRFRSASPSSGILSADEVLKTDLDDLRDLPPECLRFLYKIAKKNGGTKRLAHIKGHRPIDESPSSRGRTRHSSDDESLEELEDVDRVSFRHSEAEISSYRSAELGRDPPEWWYKHSSWPREAARFLWWGLAPESCKIFTGPVKPYYTHCALHGIQPVFPATFYPLASWIGELSVKRIKAKTIESYLTAVRSAHVDMSYYDLSVFHSPGLKRMIAGVRRLQGEAGTQERRPITKDLLL